MPQYTQPKIACMFHLNLESVPMHTQCYGRLQLSQQRESALLTVSSAMLFRDIAEHGHA